MMLINALRATAIDRRRLQAVGAIAGAAFFLLYGYESVRSASVSLFIDAYGAANLPYVMALSPVGTVAMIYGYGRLLSRLGAGATLALTSLLSAAALGLCYLSFALNSGPAVAMLYVLREGYVVLVIEQYWSFINSTLEADEAKALNGPICGIASVGAILGGLTVGHLAPLVGSEALVQVAVATMLPAALLGWLAYRVGGRPRGEGAAQTAAHSTLGLGLFRQHRVLVHIAVLILLTQMVSTLLELRFGLLVEEVMPAKDERTAYFGNFWGLLNSAAFFLQFVVTPLLLRRWALRRVHLAIPVVHMVAAVLVCTEPSLIIVAGGYLIFKSVDYSVFRAAKEILYVPLPFDARYRAKEVIDAFGYRAAKGATAGLIAGIVAMAGALPGIAYPVAAFVAAMAWLRTADRATR